MPVGACYSSWSATRLRPSENQSRGSARRGTGRIGGGAGVLHVCPQAEQWKVSTSGLSGMTRRALEEEHAGQMLGKTITART
jgi:hypothetical protein